MSVELLIFVQSHRHAQRSTQRSTSDVAAQKCPYRMRPRSFDARKPKQTYTVGHIFIIKNEERRLWITVSVHLEHISNLCYGLHVVGTSGHAGSNKTHLSTRSSTTAKHQMYSLIAYRRNIYIRSKICLVEKRSWLKVFSKATARKCIEKESTAA